VRFLRHSAARLAAAAVLAAFLLCACALGRERPPAEEERPRVRDIQDIERRLQAADAASPNLLLGEIGRISAGTFDAPVWRVAYRSFEKDVKRVLVLAGSRGNDEAGVQLALELVERLAAGPASDRHLDLDIIPLANPWGYVHGLGFGKDGTDIERDFVAFDSSEARVIRRFLREKRYDLVIDLQEAPAAAGFTLVQYGLEDTAAAGRIADSLLASGHAPSRDGRLAFQKPRDGVLFATNWGLAAMRMSRTLTLGGYLRENVSPVVYSIETPMRLPLSERLAIQRLATEILIAEFGAGPRHR
jgi:hypothetical protein